ncbi:MAG: ABC transporter permease [Actinobacteria bacterium]|nr:ABC transporter permease [Actinomycetota bacterium]|tara:strand:+ start:93 stop:863 length:771 start_codon:yes stop_codon:yes gene_type:complete
MNGQIIGLKTIVRREVTRLIRIWRQTILPPIITSTLYFLIFGNFIGDRIGDIENTSYLSFMVPGLILMTVITNSFTNVSSTVFGAKFQKSLEELLVSPLKNTTILTGYILSGVIRGCMTGLMVSIVSLFFAPIHIYSYAISIISMLLTSILFSLAGFINALYAKSFDDISILPTFILTPLTYLGGVFYSVSLLPPLWQQISYFNPVLYLINLFRYGFIGISDINTSYSLIILTIFTALFWVLSLHLLKKGFAGYRT